MIRVIFIILFFGSCSKPSPDPVDEKVLEGSSFQKSGVELVILGTIQDAGSPHIGCKKSCCSTLTLQDEAIRQISCLGVIDHDSKRTYLLDATPDLTAQVENLQSRASWEAKKSPDGVFLTHAHIGHYTGLMYFGREALGGRGIKTYAMPRMVQFLVDNGPWSQLVKLENIVLQELEADLPTVLSKHLEIIPFRVPHRDEFSETVGFKVVGPQKSILFIPDIDKWELWDRSILDEIRNVNYAFLDASFYNTEELGHREPSEIPHPLVEESMKLFDELSEGDKMKIHFIHLNHTNPLLNKDSKEYHILQDRGYKLAAINSSFHL